MFLINLYSFSFLDLLKEYNVMGEELTALTLCQDLCREFFLSHCKSLERKYSTYTEFYCLTVLFASNPGTRVDVKLQ